jgi:hypothetical protein
MRKLIRTTVLGTMLATGVAAPALADPDDRRKEMREERREYRKDRREAAREYRKDRREAEREYRKDLREARRDGRDWQAYRRYDYNRPDPAYGNYYADRYYRDGGYYQPRQLSYNDRIYRGQDGRYYCRRDDGTTGLVIGALGGGVLGNVIAPGGSKTLGTIIGAVGGGVLGRALDRGNAACR